MLSRILRSFSLLPYENLSKILYLNRNWQSGIFAGLRILLAIMNGFIWVEPVSR
jgi:hypothetical protein